MLLELCLVNVPKTNFSVKKNKTKKQQLTMQTQTLFAKSCFPFDFLSI